MVTGTSDSQLEDDILFFDNSALDTGNYKKYCDELSVSAKYHKPMKDNLADGFEVLGSPSADFIAEFLNGDDLEDDIEDNKTNITAADPQAEIRYVDQYGTPYNANVVQCIELLIQNGSINCTGNPCFVNESSLPTSSDCGGLLSNSSNASETEISNASPQGVHLIYRGMSNEIEKEAPTESSGANLRGASTGGGQVSGALAGPQDEYAGVVVGPEHFTPSYFGVPGFGPEFSQFGPMYPGYGYMPGPVYGPSPVVYGPVYDRPVFGPSLPVYGPVLPLEVPGIIVNDPFLGPVIEPMLPVGRPPVIVPAIDRDLGPVALTLKNPSRKLRGSK